MAREDISLQPADSLGHSQIFIEANQVEPGQETSCASLDLAQKLNQSIIAPECELNTVPLRYRLLISETCSDLRESASSFVTKSFSAVLIC